MLLLKSYDNEPLNLGTLLDLIEHKSQFPQSKTVIVVDIDTFDTGEADVTDAIRENFSSASTPCPFQLLIIDDESNGSNEEFRLENWTTREVLQLKNIENDSLFVTKIKEIYPAFYSDHVFAYKFFLVERSRF